MSAESYLAQHSIKHPVLVWRLHLALVYALIALPRLTESLVWLAPERQWEWVSIEFPLPFYSDSFYSDNSAIQINY